MKQKKITIKKSKKAALKNKKIDKNILDKIDFYSKIIENTILFVQKYKILDIINASQLNECIEKLLDINSNLLIIRDFMKSNNNSSDFNQIYEKLQNINDELSFIFRNYGTKNITDLLTVVFGNQYLDNIDLQHSKFNLVKKFIHPISYKIMEWKPPFNTNKKKNTRIARNRIVEDFMIVETGKTLDCFDLARSSSVYQTKVMGIKICFQNPEANKSLIVCCICDEIILQACPEKFVFDIFKELNTNKPKEQKFFSDDFTRFTNSLTLKELLVYNTTEIYHKYNGFCIFNNNVKQKPIADCVRDFLAADLYNQRKQIIQLLIKTNNPEFEYLAYLLYDLLSSEDNTNNIDTQEQTLLFDSLPWNIKKFFKHAMKNTMTYTNSIAEFESSKIPLEQRICLMKAPRSVKEKAMIKLKEVKAKSEDSGSKARHYLEGLLKIPFGQYRNEDILNSLSNSTTLLNSAIQTIIDNEQDDSFTMSKKYTTIELSEKINDINIFLKSKQTFYYNSIVSSFTNQKRNVLVDNICYINNIIKQLNLKSNRLCHSGKKVSYMKKYIHKFIEDNKDNDKVINLIAKINNIKKYNYDSIISNIDLIKENIDNVNTYISKISNTLNSSVHGHYNAKRSIERIIGQWISGKQDGYCFGFEGPPGVGKTSLARKGLAHCLKGSDGETRPFQFIAIGGASNGSTLSGHNYTYVGSTWGKIVDILMDTKCMNPIIFIDELDKISRTENGKEIIGILTHLVDRTQNEQFQDKYFNGIDLDLSKALFIFSYNDVSAIDRILLDRIHRIKFDHLTIQDKIEICKNFILPEFYENFNINIPFTDEMLKFIIETYTNESGVRKLKEIIFDIISEINLEILQKNITTIPLLTPNNIANKYLKERNQIIIKEIHDESQIGLINGLWANSLGMGGIIPIEANLLPCNNFLELQLTGLQGDVMKESMNVAKTLTWKLTSPANRKKFIKNAKTTKLQGIHIHCPEGAVPKDGPSAGTAITICVYSLLNNKKIKHNLAITGEINLQGKVTQIGGLDLKILGGIRAGVKTFLFPKSNKEDYDKLYDKQTDKTIFEGISFIPVDNIQDVLKLVFI